MKLKDWIEKNKQWQIELGKRLGHKSGGIITTKKQTALVDDTERIIKKCAMPIVVVSEQEPPCTGCGKVILTEDDQCSGCRIADALLD